MIAGWTKGLPHLPKAFTSWLAQNAWCLTIIGVAGGGFSLLAALNALTVGLAVLDALGAPAFGGMLFLSHWYHSLALLLRQ